MTSLTLTSKKTFFALILTLFFFNYEKIVAQNTATLTITAPKNTTVECNGVPAAQNPSVTTTCPNSKVTITVADVKTTGNCPDSYTLTRTWTATNLCGNTASASQIITVRDSRVPIIGSIPANITVECHKIPTPVKPSAIDNCDKQVDVTHKDKITNGLCTDSYRIAREWTATDNCGNKSTKTQIITVRDITKPIFTYVPANVTVECGKMTPPVAPTASDNCDKTVNISFAETRLSSNCPESYTIKREWTASDNCGNTAKQTQIITVQDKKAPVFATIPASITADCAQVSAAVIPTATDNCDTKVDIAFKETRTNLGSGGTIGCTYSILRTWTASDNCANTATISQTLTVQDTKAPKFTTLIADLTVACGKIPAKTPPAAVDNCDLSVSFSLKETKINGTCVDNYSIKREWTATDRCGNSAMTTQMITVVDNTAPKIIGIPANIVMSCSQLFPAQNLNVVGSDECDKQVEITFKETKINGTCVDNYIIKREWTATDNCGNKSTKTQSITVKDVYAPNFTVVLQNIAVGCDKIPAASSIKAVDNCDKQVDITLNETKIAGTCSENYLLTRVWTATDNCANTKTISQTISVSDKTAPKFNNVFVDVTMECGIVLDLPIITATDNCDTSVDVTFTSTSTTGNCPANYITVYKWTATDNCGNSTTAQQTITVRDTKAPQLEPGMTAPIDLTANCGQVPPPAKLKFIDGCDVEVIVTYAEEALMLNTPCSQILKRTWIAKDDCGNSTTISHNIYLIDNQAPIFSTVPPSITVDCDSIPAATTIAVTDNCIAKPTVIVKDYEVVDSCQKTITRLWTATDACGNSAFASQTITVIDKTAPYAINPPDLTLNLPCGATIPAAPAVMFKDKCNDNVKVSYAEEIIEGENNNCPIKQITRRWTATDPCGNKTILTQVVNFETSIASGSKVAFANKKPVAQDNAALENNASINAYPNPSEGTLFINLTEKVEEIKLIDELGRIIFKQDNLSPNTFSIDLSNEQNGIYLLQTRKGEVLQTQKIVLLKR